MCLTLALEANIFKSLSSLFLLLISCSWLHAQVEFMGKPLGEFKTLPGASLVLHDSDVDEYTRAPQARRHFKVDGEGLAAVVIDSGVNYYHKSLKDRVILDPNEVPVGHDMTGTSLIDTYGHGSGTAGLIAGRRVPSSGITDGIAPKAKIIPVKVYNSRQDGSRPVADINRALQWVLDNHQLIRHQYDVRIGVVNLSLGFSQNAPGDFQLDPNQRVECGDLIQSLREEGILVVVASGNLFHDYDSAQGMDFPAICNAAISVGAVYDVTVDYAQEPYFYMNGCMVRHAVKNRIAPFSQRLSFEKSPEINTTIFAPGHDVYSVCPWDANDPNRTKTAASHNDGTSRAAPIVSGAVLLLQQRYEKERNRPGLPKATTVIRALRKGGHRIHDKEEAGGNWDNVHSTNAFFDRLDIYKALETMDGFVHDELSRALISVESRGGPTDLSMPRIQ